jgi:ATP-dependent RNA helicase DDX23/PRP28
VQRRPASVTIGTAGRPVDRITQHVLMMDERQKAARLKEILESDPEPPIIIFVNQKKGVLVCLC